MAQGKPNRKGFSVPRAEVGVSVYSSVQTEYFYD